jgi:DNA-directed RNA polymerase subunit F
MIGKEVKEQRPVTLAEVLEVMESRKTDGELGFEQQATYDYLKARKILDKKKALGMLKELSGIEKITPEIAIKIIDILPRSEAQLSIIVAKERHAFSKAEMAEILKIVEKHAEE